MPKEITHWLIAGRAAQAARDTFTGEAALARPNALRLGAVFPDVLYYLTDAAGVAAYRHIPEIYHGVGGEDTYALVRRIAALLPATSHRTALRAFLAGVVSHIQADMTFHPFVYYVTGDYEDADPDRRSRAIKDHRRLECLMDLHFCGGAGKLKAYSLKHIVEGLEMPLPELLGLLFRPEAEGGRFSAAVPVARRALSNFQLLQGLSTRRLLARLLDCLAPFLPRTAQEIIALFYSPALDRYLPRLAGAIAYRNPVNGTAETLSVTGLFDRAVARCVEYWRRIEEEMAAGAPILPEKGPSLGYGVADGAGAVPRYFAERRFFGPDGP